MFSKGVSAPNALINSLRLKVRVRQGHLKAMPSSSRRSATLTCMTAYASMTRAWRCEQTKNILTGFGHGGRAVSAASSMAIPSTVLIGRPAIEPMPAVRRAPRWSVSLRARPRALSRTVCQTSSSGTASSAQGRRRWRVGWFPVADGARRQMGPRAGPDRRLAVGRSAGPQGSDRERQGGRRQSRAWPQKGAGQLIAPAAGESQATR